jgi:hypothetical protein
MANHKRGLCRQECCFSLVALVAKSAANMQNSLDACDCPAPELSRGLVGPDQLVIQRYGSNRELSERDVKRASNVIGEGKRQRALLVESFERQGLRTKFP